MRSLVSLAALSGAVVLLTVFPSGAFAWMPALVSLALGLAAVITTSRPPAGHEVVGRSFDAPAAVILVFMLLSLVPLIPLLTWVFGPARHAEAVRAAEAVREAWKLGILDQGQPAALFSFTHNRAGTLRLLILASGTCSAAVLASRLTVRDRRLFLLAAVIIGSVAGVAGYISSRWSAQRAMLWWAYKVPAELPGPMVCFCNRNHFAAFLAMLAPAALCLSLRQLSRNLFFFLLLLAMFFAITGGVVFSCSRGGWAAYLFGMIALAAGLLAVRRVASAVAVLLAGCAAAAVVLGMPEPALRERVATLQDARGTDSYTTRVQCWKDSLRIWRSHPLLGVGANGFRTVFPRHRTTSESSFMTHAENEYVQTLADGGLLGTALACWLLLVVARAAILALRGGETEYAHSIAALSALAAAAVSAGVDFAMHIPLYAITLAAIAGLLFKENAEPGSGRRILLPVLAISASVIAGVWSFRMEDMDDPRWIHGARPTQLARALVWAPTFSYAWHGLGRAAWAAGGAANTEFGERCMSRAVEYDPNNYRLWKELGLIRMSIGNAKGAREAFGRVKALRTWVPVPEVPEVSR